MLKRSVIIAGRHDTSVSLEKEFWSELQNLAKAKNLSINQIVTEIDKQKTTSNLSSAIRIFILKELKKTLK